MVKYYDRLIEDLNTRIDSQYPSVKAFCEKFNYSRHNLSRIFNCRQGMTLILYMSICKDLGVLRPESNIIQSDLLLKDYLSIMPDSIVSSVLELITNPTGEK